MAEFVVKVVKLDRPVEDHPNADRLSLVYVDGYVCIDRKNEDGSHRMTQGDYVAYVPESSLLNEPLLRAMNMWKAAVPAIDAVPGTEDTPAQDAIPATEGIGLLDGSGHNRVKARKLRGIFSQGLVYHLPEMDGVTYLDVPVSIDVDGILAWERHAVSEGQDVKELLGIEKWEPVVPIGMNGQFCALGSVVMHFDFESLQSLPDLFVPGELVDATEKGHGTFCQFGLVPGLAHEECFSGGDIYVTSKGMGNKGLALKDNAANDTNLYVTTLRAELEKGLAGRMVTLSNRHGGVPVRVCGEIMGRGVQDLHYGFQKPVLRVFDVFLEGTPARPETTKEWVLELELEVMPTLYSGPYDMNELVKHRDGKDTFSRSHVREGIVVRAADGGYHPQHGRKIGKLVSPAYLLRSNKDATEFQ